MGSNPAALTNSNATIAQLVEALDSESSKCRFESDSWHWCDGTTLHQHDDRSDKDSTSIASDPRDKADPELRSEIREPSGSRTCWSRAIMVIQGIR